MTVASAFVLRVVTAIGRRDVVLFLLGLLLGMVLVSANSSHPLVASGVVDDTMQQRKNKLLTQELEECTRLTIGFQSDLNAIQDRLDKANGVIRVFEATSTLNDRKFMMEEALNDALVAKEQFELKVKRAAEKELIKEEKEALKSQKKRLKLRDDDVKSNSTSKSIRATPAQLSVIAKMKKIKS
jgi:hypothetical protein